MDEIKHQCSKQIPNDHWGFHYHSCKRQGIIQRDGKWYCKVHDPIEVEARGKKSSTEWHNKFESVRINEVAGQQCRLINPENPLIVAENIKALYDSVQTYFRTQNPDEMSRVLNKIEGK
jgi:hypothetical protein